MKPHQVPELLKIEDFTHSILSTTLITYVLDPFFAA